MILFTRNNNAGEGTEEGTRDSFFGHNEVAFMENTGGSTEVIWVNISNICKGGLS